MFLANKEHPFSLRRTGAGRKKPVNFSEKQGKERICFMILRHMIDPLDFSKQEIGELLDRADDIAADFEDAKALLDDAGNPQKHEGYDQAKWQVVRDELARFLTWKTTQTTDKGANE